MINHAFARTMNEQATESIMRVLPIEMPRNSFLLKSHQIDEMFCDCDTVASRILSSTNCSNASTQHENQHHEDRNRNIKSFLAGKNAHEQSGLLAKNKTNVVTITRKKQPQMQQQRTATSRVTKWSVIERTRQKITLTKIGKKKNVV